MYQHPDLFLLELACPNSRLKLSSALSQKKKSTAMSGSDNEIPPGRPLKRKATVKKPKPGSISSSRTSASAVLEGQLKIHHHKYADVCMAGVKSRKSRRDAIRLMHRNHPNSHFLFGRVSPEGMLSIATDFRQRHRVRPSPRRTCFWVVA